MSLLSKALQSFNAITGSVEVEKLSKLIDQPLRVSGFSLKESAGQEIPHYTMLNVVGMERPVGTASDQIFTDLLILANQLKNVPGVTVEDIHGASDVDPETGELRDGKRVILVTFPATDLPVFVAHQIDTGNSGRSVFKITAFDPELPATAEADEPVSSGDGPSTPPPLFPEEETAAGSKDKGKGKGK